MVVKNEIVEGLRLAVSKGESLRNAMMSFYNAGYSKQDIEDSAKALNQNPIQVVQPQQTAQQLQTQQTQQGQQPALVQNIQQPQQIQQTPNLTQKVSGYGRKTGFFSNTVVIILVFALLFLLGVLLLVFLFRDELASLFNGIF